jgi:cyclophilin family peptidyl-prolyl cis-trans isomerase
LDGKHTVFGQVDLDLAAGAAKDALEDIAVVKLNSKNRPMADVRM